jgi:hypothetical protein
MVDQNPFRPPEQTSDSPKRDVKAWMSPLVWFCLSFYAIAVYMGVRSTLITDGAAGDRVIGFVLSICLCAWALTDARQRQKPIPRSQAIWFAIFAGLVVPGYVIVTRGWKGLGWVIFHVVGLFVVSTLAMHVTGVIYFGSDWWQALWET